MKTCFRVLGMLLCVIMCFHLAACSGETQTEETMAVVFSEKYLNVAEVSPEDWIESLNNLGAEQYAKLYVNDDGVSVTLEITQAQKDFWISAVNQGLQKLKGNFEAIDSAYSITWSGDYACIDFHYNLNLPAADAIYYVIYSEVYCAFGQLLNGADAGSWTVSFNIYNSDTGKLVTSGDSNTGLSYNTSDWEASE